MINYDISQNPPAPMLQVTISGVRRTFPHRTMSALLDTGGDVTAIPRALVNILRLYKVGQIQIEGVEGAPNIFHLYAVKLKLNGITIPRVEVIATDLDIVVVGRDVLNQFYFLLNGPEQTFDLRQTSFL
jgi:predicted aspartyl protease